MEENHVAEKEVPLMFGEDFLHGKEETHCWHRMLCRHHELSHLSSAQVAILLALQPTPRSSPWKNWTHPSLPFSHLHTPPSHPHPPLSPQSRQVCEPVSTPNCSGV